jgi:hypothetical protein
MNGRTNTGQRRLAEAVAAAHEAVQEAHARMYDVELAIERAQNDRLAGAGVGAVLAEDVAQLGDRRTECAEYRALLVPLARWTARTRREVGGDGS